MEIRKVIQFLSLWQTIYSSIAQENNVMPKKVSPMDENYCIQPEGIIWLGQSLTLMTKKVPNIKRPIRWHSNKPKFECDWTCGGNSDYKVNETDGVSTVWIKSVSLENDHWNFRDDAYHTGEIILSINVKPKTDIKNITDCEYKVMAECSLPQTSIECFIGGNPVTLTSNTAKLCSDGKTVTSTATLKLSEGSGILKCYFTMGNGKLFNETKTTKVECNNEGNGVNSVHAPWIVITVIIIVAQVFV